MPSTVIQLPLVISETIDAFTVERQELLISNLRNLTGCYEPECRITLRISAASISVVAVIVIADDQPEGANATAIVGNVEQSARELVALPAEEVSTLLEMTVESTDSVIVETDVVVPLVVAPPPPSEPLSSPPPPSYPQSCTASDTAVIEFTPHALPNRYSICIRLPPCATALPASLTMRLSQCSGFALDTIHSTPEVVDSFLPNQALFNFLMLRDPTSSLLSLDCDAGTSSLVITNTAACDYTPDPADYVLVGIDALAFTFASPPPLPPPPPSPPPPSPSPPPFQTCTLDHTMLTGAGLFDLQTYTPDGTMVAEITGSTDFQTIASEFSCAIVGNSSLVSYQPDVRGWTCFDVAHVSTIGVAQNRSDVVFGTECSGHTVGDGVITIEDVLLVLLAHYNIPPYDSVPLNTTTITAPLTYDSHYERCGSGSRTPATCDDVALRRSLQMSSVWYDFSIVTQTSWVDVEGTLRTGMWVKLDVKHPSQLVTGNLYIYTADDPSGISGSTNVKELDFSLHEDYQGGGDQNVAGETMVLYDPRGTSTLLSMTGRGYMSVYYKIFTSLPYGQPSIYLWTPSSSICIRHSSSLTRLHTQPSSAAYIWQEDECLYYVDSPTPPPSPKEPSSAPPAAPPPIGPTVAPADPPSLSPSPGMSTAAIVGIVLTCIAVLLTVGFATRYALQLRARRMESSRRLPYIVRNTPRASTPRASTPRASAPRASTPRASAPRASAPRASAPRASAQRPPAQRAAPRLR